MKKLLAITLALALTFCLAACGGGNGDADVEITRDETENTQTVTDTGSTDTDSTDADAGKTEDEGVYSFTAEGVELVPGESFDASKLPEAQSVFTVPSCALEGTDNVYSYGTYEVTAYNEGDGEHIYSIYLFNPNVTTNEGLAVGDTKDKVVETYGENFTDNNGEYTYKKGDTLLVIVFQNDTVLSIDFRLDV